MAKDLHDYETQIGLVLRKSLYSETSLIIACLTREVGQLHVMVRGGAKPGKKTFPAADLFREVEVVYKHSSKTELQTARSIDLVCPYDAIARQPANFQAAGWLCKFALRNTVVAEPAPLIYEAMRVAFMRLAAPGPSHPDAITLGVCFVAIAEHGLLPDTRLQAHIAEHIQQMQEFALHPDRPVPDYPQETWQSLHAWMMRYLRRVALFVPGD